MPRTADETWGRSTVRTACPLDCPDSCTLDVTLEKGRVVKLDGGSELPRTKGATGIDMGSGGTGTDLE